MKLNKYRVLKYSLPILFAILIGIPFLIIYFKSTMCVCVGFFITKLIIKWYEYFDKKERLE